MTVAQAKAAYGPDLHDFVGKSTRSSEHSMERLVIDHLSVSDIALEASLYAVPGSDTIRAVYIRLPEGVTKANGAFGVLLNALTQKYGLPTRRDDPKISAAGRAENIVWVFPSTVIELFWIHAGSVDFDIISLSYTATDKKALDVL